MKWKGSILAIIIGVTALTLMFIRMNNRIKEKISREEAAQKAAQQDMPAYTPPIDSFPYLYKSYEVIAATQHSRVFLLKDSMSKVKAGAKLADADGDMVFMIGQKDVPYTVHTRILQLTVLKPSVFRVEAFHKDNGEKVDVLEGEVRAAKRYKSQFPEPDTVRKSEMVMINDQIDLMEKEKEDLTDFARWWSSITPGK